LAVCDELTLLLGATKLGLPVSTTHSIVGAIVGFGAVAIGVDAVNWGKVWQIVVSWVTSPLISGVLAFAIFQLTRRLILDRDDPIDKAYKTLSLGASAVLVRHEGKPIGVITKSDVISYLSRVNQE